MKKGWEKPRCDICQTDKYLKVLYKGLTTWEHRGKFTFVKCRQCGFVFQSPRAAFKEAVGYYPPEFYWGRDVTKLKRNKDWKIERENAYAFLYKGIFEKKKKGSILDIGSGLGLFLSKFKDLGWEVWGTDISPDIGKYSKKIFGIDVLIGDIVKLKIPKNHFDVITMNGVFEHVYNPRKTLVKLRQLIKDGGFLVMVVPNIESLGYTLFRKRWYHFQPGRHINQFSPTTITRLLQDTGFFVEEISHSYWAHNNYSLFENIRFNFSPRFKKADAGGLAKGTIKDLEKPSELSLTKEVGKLVARLLAFIGSLVEPIIQKGEVITVYARKT